MDNNNNNNAVLEAWPLDLPIFYDLPTPNATAELHTPVDPFELPHAPAEEPDVPAELPHVPVELPDVPAALHEHVPVELPDVPAALPSPRDIALLRDDMFAFSGAVQNEDMDLASAFVERATHAITRLFPLRALRTRNGPFLFTSTVTLLAKTQRSLRDFHEATAAAANAPQQQQQQQQQQPLGGNVRRVRAARPRETVRNVRNVRQKKGEWDFISYLA